MYGLGASEEVLAEAFGSERRRVTIATKVGLPRPRAGSQLASIKALLRPLVSVVPGLRARLASGFASLSGADVRDYSAPFMAASLDESLRRLGDERVEALLLHEITPSEVTEEVERFLEDARASGKIGTFGIATSTAATQAIVDRTPSVAPVVQSGWGVFDNRLVDDGRRLWITHRPLQRAHARLKALVSADRAAAGRLSAEVGRDVGDPECLAEVLLAAALANNPTGIVLVSSRRTERVRRFGAIQGNSDLIAAGSRLIAALQTNWVRSRLDILSLGSLP